MKCKSFVLLSLLHTVVFDRFCQQCGALEPLDRFDGTKRSCREKIEEKRQRANRKSTGGTTRNGSSSRGQGISRADRISSPDLDNPDQVRREWRAVCNMSLGLRKSSVAAHGRRQPSAMQVVNLHASCV